MNSRPTIALIVTLLAATIFEPSAPAQMRRMGISAPSPQARFSSRFRARLNSGPRFGFGRMNRQFFPGSVFLPPYYFPAYDYYDYDLYEPIGPQPPSSPQVIVMPPASAPTPAPAPAVSPVESLVLENRDGLWVRVSNYSQLPAPVQSAAPDVAP